MSEGFCIKCSKEVESFEGLNCCPSCGTKSIPCSNENQVSVSINLQELRVLCMWAEFWVMNVKDEQEQASMAGTVRGIVGRLKKQIPQKVQLLLSDEIQELKDNNFDVESNITTI